MYLLNKEIILHQSHYQIKVQLEVGHVQEVIPRVLEEDQDLVPVKLDLLIQYLLI